MTHSRHKARQIALQGIYAWLLSGNPAKDIKAYLWEHHQHSSPDIEYFDDVFFGVIAHRETLDIEIERSVDRPLSQLSPVEHALLLMGSYELQYHPEIPYIVVINEAVELGKAFGATDGFKYINGVLDKLSKTLRALEVKHTQAERR